MKIEITTDKNTTTGHLTGRLDNASFAQFSRSLEPLTESSGKHVVLDCSGLQFISLRGLQFFHWLQNNIQQQGRYFSMKNVAATIVQMISAAGFATMLNME